MASIRGSLQRLVDSTVDEINYKYRFHQTPPNEIILFVTSLCNFACETCFYAEKLNDVSNDLSYEEIVKISNNLKTVRLLLLTGGEPYLRREMVEIVDLFYKQNNTRKLHLPTNGFYVEKTINDTEKMLNLMPDLSINIGVSLDGLGEKHDQISKKKGAFENAIKTQRGLMKLEQKYPNLRTQFYCVVSDNNAEETKELFEYINRNFGCDKIGYSPLRGDPADPSLKPPSSKQWDDIFNVYMTYAANSKTNTGLFRYLLQRKIKAKHRLNKKIMGEAFEIKGRKNSFSTYPCTAGTNICAIDADGAVRVCELKEPVGNLRDYGYDVRKLLSTKHCHECSCTHACFQNASADMSPISYVKQFI